MVGMVKCLQLNICKRTEDSFQTSSWRQKLDILDRKSITIWYFKPKRVFFLTKWLLCLNLTHHKHSGISNRTLKKTLRCIIMKCKVLIF